MKKLFVLLIVINTLFVFTTVLAEDLEIAESLDLEGFKAEMVEWAEGRWLNWQVFYDSEEQNVIVRVWVSPSANKIAMEGYCEVIKDLYEKYAPGYSYEYNVFLYKGEKIAHTCR